MSEKLQEAMMKILQESATNKYEIELNSGAIERTRMPNETNIIEGYREDLMEYLNDSFVDCTLDDEDELVTFEQWVSEYEDNYDPSGSTVVLKITENGKEIFKNSDYDEYQSDYDED